MSENNVLAEWGSKINIYFKYIGGDEYSMVHSDKLTNQQAQTIAKVSIRASSYLTNGDEVKQLSIANILALLVIQFNTDLTTLSNAPKEMFMLDLVRIFEEYSASDDSFDREPHFLSDSFKGMF